MRTLARTVRAKQATAMGAWRSGGNRVWKTCVSDPDLCPAFRTTGNGNQLRLRQCGPSLKCMRSNSVIVAVRQEVENGDERLALGTKKAAIGKAVAERFDLR